MVWCDTDGDTIWGDEMIRMPAGYNAFHVIRDVDLKISFSVLDTNADKERAAIETNDGGVFNNIRQTVDGTRIPGGKYTSLESDLWLLDGTFDVLPDDISKTEVGVWSNAISDADGVFDIPPTIRYTFGSTLSTLGWTIHFDVLGGQYATRVAIVAYDADGAVVDAGEYDNDSSVMAVQHYASGYSSVEFKFLSTNEPLRRLRLLEVDFGLTKAYDRNSLGSAQIIYGADILSRSLPMRELIFTFDNSDKQYNLLNPDGVYQHLQDGQVISAVISIDGMDVDMGDFYFTKADVSSSGIVPEITAHDKIIKLDGAVFDGGTGAAMTLSGAISVVLGDFDIPIYYGEGVGDTMVTLSTPRGDSVLTARECIRMLAQAAMCSVLVNRDGVLCFVRFDLKDAEDGTITADELYDYSGVTIADKVDGVTLTVLSEYDSDGERLTYTAGDVGVGMNVSAFRNPCVAPENGAAVAKWLLDGLRRRKNYAVKNRCDPAVEIGDTLRIDDIFGNRETAIVTGIEIDYDGTLSAITKGVGA